MTPDMKIGLTAYNIPAPEFQALAATAEEAGFSSLWLGEHVVLPVKYESTHPSTERTDAVHIAGPIIDAETELVDPLVAISAAAAVTSTIELATGIYVVPLRHPLAIARATCTTQDIADGRFTLGVGFGWLKEEFEALGVPFPQRIGRFEESLEILRAAWSAGPVNYAGRYFEVRDVQVTHRPVRVPLILGGNSEAALERAVRLGDGWFASGTPTFEAAIELRKRIGELHATGPRPSSEFRVAFRIADTDDSTIERYADAGFGEVLIWADQLWDLDAPADERRERFLAVAERIGIEPGQ